LPQHPRTLPGRFLTASPGNPRAYTSRPLREVPLVAKRPADAVRAFDADDEDRRREVERVATATDIRDEPECISRAWLATYAEVSKRIFDQQHAIDVAAARELRPMLDAEDRVRDIQRRAKYAHVDLSREVLLMRRDILRAKAGNRRPPLRVLDRCERLESLLDGIAA
jgi:hypothetical protein